MTPLVVIGIVHAAVSGIQLTVGWGITGPIRSYPGFIKRIAGFQIAIWSLVILMAST